MTTQLVTRVSDDLVAALDALVSDGTVANRSEGVRVALESWVDRQRRDRIGAAIVDGYQRCPQTDDDLAWVERASARTMASDPW